MIRAIFSADFSGANFRDLIAVKFETVEYSVVIQIFAVGRAGIVQVLLE